MPPPPPTRLLVWYAVWKSTAQNLVLLHSSLFNFSLKWVRLVLLTPGSALFRCGSNVLRLSFICSKPIQKFTFILLVKCQLGTTDAIAGECTARVDSGRFLFQMLMCAVKRNGVSFLEFCLKDCFLLPVQVLLLSVRINYMDPILLESFVEGWEVKLKVEIDR